MKYPGGLSRLKLLSAMADSQTPKKVPKNKKTSEIKTIYLGAINRLMITPKNKAPTATNLAMANSSGSVAPLMILGSLSSSEAINSFIKQLQD